MRDLKNTCRVAVVQATPVMFRKDKCLEKALRLIDEAAGEGAELIVFPELFIPGYPYGMTFGFTVGSRRADGRQDWKQYYDNSLLADGPEMQQLSYSGVNSASMCRRCVPPAARTALEARIVSICASYAQFSLLAMKRDGRKGSANPSRPMESRRLTPPRLDRNRNAHPSAGIGGAFLVRKNAVSASQKQRGPSCGATRRKRPLCLVLRRAILLPRAAELSLPVCRLPSQDLRPNG